MGSDAPRQAVGWPAAIPVSYLTACPILFRAAALRPGERVLVPVAAGGPARRRTSRAARQ